MAPATTSTADALQRAQVDTINNTELCSNAQDVIMAIQAARPKNTHKAYKPKQKEFRKQLAKGYGVGLGEDEEEDINDVVKST